MIKKGQWTWVDGTALGTYSGWAPGQPDNYYGGQHCAYYWGSRDYRWDDGECDSYRFAFICQVPLSALSQSTTEIPTTPRLETSPTSTTVRTTQATSTPSQVSSTPRLTQLSTLPGTTVSEHTTTQAAAQQSTRLGTTVSQSPTYQTTKLAGGSWNKTKPCDMYIGLVCAAVCGGCAVGLVGMCGVHVLLFCGKRRQKRQVAQHPQDLDE
ncbi:uncharacterized protein LOC144903056 [Branchiostoma floridae x Branchiostoma belcheri]